MTEPRYRYSGRRSPTSNPARASLPVGVGYNPHLSGDLHAIPTARYDAAAPRRVNDHKASSSSTNPPTTTITTYNVTKEPAPRTSNTARRRSSTVDSGAPKPIIVTTNHATRPSHGSSSHTSSAARQTSPSHDPYRSSDETYYTLPASTTTSRSQRYHGYSQSATLSNDELRRLRERVGGIDDRLRAPTHTATDYYRYSLPHANYATPSHDLDTTAVIDYENEGYEYAKPGDLARYDLDHNRQQSRGRRRESVDRPPNNYFRPTVNVVSNDPGRYDASGPGPGRGRGPPPLSSGLDRFNRAAAAGIYDRPTVTMPALPPPVPAAPPVDPKRRIEAAPRDPSPERRVAARPRPVSLYQDTPARITHADDLYRSHDDERLHRRRERDDPYLDPEVSARGFGIRTDSLKVEQPDRPARSVDRRDYDDRRLRREAAEREPRRRSDESIDYARSHDTRQSIDDTVSRDSRDSRDTLNRKGSLGGRARDKVAAGLGVAAAAMGLAAPKEMSKDDDRRVSPRRRDTIDEEVDVGSSRNSDRYKPKERDVVERKPSPREDATLERRESRRERAESTSATRGRDADRELERERIRERALDRERERDRDQREQEKERERELEQREREKERDRSRERSERIKRDTEAVLNGSTAADKRDDSPASDDTKGASRRRGLNSAFDPTNTNDLLDVKAELAAKDSQEKPKERSPVGDRSSNKEASPSASTERQSTDSGEESRGREVVATSEKQVRVVSPPRDKSEQKPIKGILKPPSAKFPEEENPIREGVAPHKDDKTKKGVPPGARWTKVNRRLISPAALAGKERFEVRDDFVIVLRVLNKEEIQDYANATAQIRAAKRKEYEKEMGSNHDYDSRDDEEKRLARRHRREHDDDYDYRRDDDRERHRRHRRDDDSDDDGRGTRALEYETSNTNRRDVARHHRSVRDHDYDSVTTNSDTRR
ncbi:hypothetical protein F5B19DRAFT_456466 [Rostrohypoxylon terebratum]|nr:hypothetical protein F5B19DRAFT_456466 [Rostrohypoxylon terebratum]